MTVNILDYWITLTLLVDSKVTASPRLYSNDQYCNTGNTNKNITKQNVLFTQQHKLGHRILQTNF